MNFRHLDLNLLRVLCAIYRCGSVTGAGHELSLSQPATSNSLARLRDFFDDALFTRTPTGLQPTASAHRIVPQVQSHLHAIEVAVLSGEEFTAATSRRHWRLSLSDLGEMMFLPALAGTLRTHSPHSRISNVAIEAAQVDAALLARDVDLAIGILKPTHAGVKADLLFRERFVALSRKRSMPLAGNEFAVLTRAQLARSQLAVATPSATAHGSVDALLHRLKLDERVAVHARHYGALPDLVLQADLVAIVPLMYARSVSALLPLQVWELPGTGVRYDVHMLWSASSAKELAHAWLRSTVTGLFKRTGTA